MKFGLIYELSVPRPFTPEGERLVIQNGLEQTRLADELGFDVAWAVEHHFREGRSHCPAPEVLLGALSQVTENIGLGFGVTLTPFGLPVEPEVKIT